MNTLKPFEPSSYIKSDEDAAFYVSAAMEDGASAEHIGGALDDVAMAFANATGIEPTNNLCLVLPDPVAKQIGSIQLPDSVLEKESWKRQRCTLIAKGVNAFHDWNGDEPRAGDRVFVAQYAGTKIEADDGQTYWIIKDLDIIGRLVS